MLTIQKLHKIIRDNVGILSSKYAPSQKIDRTTYDVKEFKGFFGVMSSNHINEIVAALEANGLHVDASTSERQFIKIPKNQ